MFMDKSKSNNYWEKSNFLIIIINFVPKFRCAEY